MKARVTAIISYAGTLFCLGTVLVLTYQSRNQSIDPISVVSVFLILVFLFSIILYIHFTRFGKNASGAERISYENEILRKQIEQKELQKKLKEGS